MITNAEASLRSLHKKLIEDLGLEQIDATSRLHLVHRENVSADELTIVYNSLSWRMTKPLRWANSALIERGLPTQSARNLSAAFMRKLRRDGVLAVLSKTLGYLGNYYSSKKQETCSEIGLQPLQTEHRAAANTLFGKSVALICESTLPQCYKYRVEQKREMLRMLGMTVNIIDWRHKNECISALQTCAIAIFYRVPFCLNVQSIYSEARRLCVPTFWEVDDLIFDVELYKSNTNMKSLPPEVVHNLLEGAKLYGACLDSSDYALTSTVKLQEVMARKKRAWVVENALDKKTAGIALGLRREKKVGTKSQKKTVDIMYGSGTKTHDIDFKEAELAVISVLAKRPNTRFIVMGDLTVSEELENSPQFVRYPSADFKSYLRQLSMADISIAPLEKSDFSEAKSNIKYLEASVLNLASVCTPTAPFANAIQHGVNGYLARNFLEWEQCLLELVDNESIRLRVARNAHKYVYRNYSLSRIARRQLLPVLEQIIIPKAKKRVLSVNVLFSPKSFGGATIIAEQMISRLSLDEGVEHFVFTTDRDIPGPDYSLKRYRALGAEVIAIKTPIHRTPLGELYDENIRRIFGEIIRSIQPDLVHFHSIQELGLSMIEVCQSENIPFFLTVHDTWWLCGRQFMVNYRNEFCGQRRIDPLICSVCVNDSKFEIYRREMSRAAINSANRILAPSEYIRGMYIANGVDPKKVYLNKNGVGSPRKMTPSRARPLTFGYVGGKTEIKGWDLVVKAFNELSDQDIRLTVVDNTLNLGFRSIDDSDFIDCKKVSIIPAYNQDTIDNFFSAIDVLLFPTQAMESFGLTVREAQIRGKWVITANAGGVIEDIEDGLNGTIIPMSKDAGYLIEAMNGLIKNPKLIEHNAFNSHIVTFSEQAEDLRRHFTTILNDATCEQKWPAAGFSDT